MGGGCKGWQVRKEVMCYVLLKIKLYATRCVLYTYILYSADGVLYPLQ